MATKKKPGTSSKTAGTARKTGRRARAVGPEAGAATDAYQHGQAQVQRPDVGVQAQFSPRKPPKTYRYDSSLDPALAWDENRERELGEWLLGLIERAAEEGEKTVFESEQVWKGDDSVRVKSTRAAVKLLKSISRPYLNWAGKAERQQISVPTVPLFVHERHSTKAILDGIRHRKAKGTTLDLFGDPKLDVGERLDAYEHQGPWQNRMILGDSLQIMNSMLEFEGLGGQVQMIYIDPPYGVKFGSNFQPFVRKRDVKDGADDDLTREPEMVKAYRDTWELGLHSYLAYMRDRLLLAKELLTDAGSIFVQISDESMTEVRALINEVFGSENYLVTLVFKKKSATHVTHAVNDFILWAAKDAKKFQPTQLYFRRPTPEDSGKYRSLVSPAGDIRRAADLSDEEIAFHIANGWKWARTDYPIVSQHPSDTRSRPYYFDGKNRRCGVNNQWRFDVPQGLDRLAAANRLYGGKGESLGGIVYWDDWPYVSFNNMWTDLHGEQNPSYVVQTSTRVVERCLLMASRPGDLIFDPTCGSGTTAYVAEQWGRRWITCDTSRVPLALARQRLLTATFPYYELKDPKRGPAGGFVYQRKQNRKGEEVGGLVPHITLKSIAKNEPPAMEVLVDRPEEVGDVTRVSGPFVVEASIAPAQSIGEAGKEATEVSGTSDVGTHLERMVQVLKQSKTLRLPGNQTLALEGVRRLSDAECLHAEAVQPESGQRVAIVFGPEDGAISSDVVFNAASEALYLKYSQLYFFGFAIQAKARELLEDRKKLRIPCAYIAVTPDVAMSDLLKTSRASEIFSVTGLPDVNVKPTGKKSESGEALFQAVLKGVDIFDPTTLEHDDIKPDQVPMWMLDTDYDGYSFHATQVFFPKTSAWDNLQKSLKATFDDSVWGHLAGTQSEPFVLGERRRVAVKVIDERGNELMRVVDVQ